MFRTPSRLGRGEMGAVSAEQVAIFIVVGAIVTALVSAAIPDTVEEQGAAAADCLFGMECESPAAADVSGSRGPADPGGAPGTGDIPDATPDLDDPADDTREDAARDARGDRRDRGRGDDTQTPPSVPDDTPPIDELGDPVPGTSTTPPAPPPWEPVDEGAGPHDSEDPGLRTRAAEVAAEVGANGLSSRWPEAARNLLHFLGNSGEPLEQDVDKLLSDVPEFADDVTDRERRLALEAVRRAQQGDESGPVTFPLSTEWQGFGYDAMGHLEYDNDNWFYALGGWQYSVAGTVTVHPPDGPGDAWTYELDTVVHLRDHYNWDGEKATQIGPLTVTDEELAAMHRAGLAQEFTATGVSSSRQQEGSAP